MKPKFVLQLPMKTTIKLGDEDYDDASSLAVELRSNGLCLHASRLEIPHPCFTSVLTPTSSAAVASTTVSTTATRVRTRTSTESKTESTGHSELVLRTGGGAGGVSSEADVVWVRANIPLPERFLDLSLLDVLSRDPDVLNVPDRESVLNIDTVTNNQSESDKNNGKHKDRQPGGYKGHIPSLFQRLVRVKVHPSPETSTPIVYGLRV